MFDVHLRVLQDYTVVKREGRECFGEINKKTSMAGLD